MLLKFGYKIATSALYVYRRRLKTAQEQAQSTNKHFNFLNFEQVFALMA